MSRSRYFVNEHCLREEEIVNNTETAKSIIYDSQIAAKRSIQKVLQRILDKEPPERAEVDGGLYVGASGISYMFLRLAEQADVLNNEVDKFKLLSLAENYLKSSLTDTQRRSGTGFLLGLCIFTYSESTLWRRYVFRNGKTRLAGGRLTFLQDNFSPEDIKCITVYIKK